MTKNIFNDSKRLARLLMSVKVNYTEGRPLSPIEVARELKSACENDLNGDVKEAQRRFDIGQSMWDGFSRLLSLTPEIQDLVIWGKSDEKLGIGFSFAHYLAKMKPEEQRAIIDISWENERVITKEDLKKIQQYLKDNPEKTIEQTIEYVLGIRRISSTIEITHHFMSDLYPEIYEKLDAKAKKENKSIKQVAKEIFSKKFKADSIKAVSPRKTWVNITFSGPGRKELNRIMEESGVGRNDIVNYIFNQEEILWQ